RLRGAKFVNTTTHHFNGLVNSLLELRELRRLGDAHLDALARHIHGKIAFRQGRELACGNHARKPFNSFTRLGDFFRPRNAYDDSTVLDTKASITHTRIAQRIAD